MPLPKILDAICTARVKADTLSDALHAAYWSSNKRSHLDDALRCWPELQAEMARVIKEFEAEVTVAQEGT